jgi:multisubunit Na+/H+ antiporter MnhE subunit
MVANVQSSTGMVLQGSVLTLTWLLFVFQLPMSELLAGAAAAALSVLVLHAGLRAVPLCFEPRLHWLAQAWQLPGMVSRDMGYLLRNVARHILHRPVRSQFLLGSFNTSDDCRGAAQRVLAVLFLSTAPNSIVVDIDIEKTSSNLLLHQLTGTTLPALIRNLEE